MIAKSEHLPFFAGDIMRENDPFAGSFANLPDRNKITKEPFQK